MEEDPSFSYTPSNYDLSGGTTKFYRELYKKQISSRLQKSNEGERNADNNNDYLERILEERNSSPSEDDNSLVNSQRFNVVELPENRSRLTHHQPQPDLL